ncbi:hypothetical protein BDQ17DRAFT_1253402 [Cyathus striatus]|nr:hypothetical protein BDQ17DRAFT_1253402 [Cyathus striatus]
MVATRRQQSQVLPQQQQEPETQTLRRSTRRTSAVSASGSEYQVSEADLPLPEENYEAEDPAEEEESKVEEVVTSRGRKTRRAIIVESEDDSDVSKPKSVKGKHPDEEDAQDEEDYGKTRRSTRRSSRMRTSKQMDGFIVPDPDDRRYPTRGHVKASQPPQPKPSGRQTRNSTNRSSLLPPGLSRKKGKKGSRRTSKENSEGDYVQNSSSSASSLIGTDVDMEEATSDMHPSPPPPEPEPEEDEEEDGKPYSLRQRQKINYAIPPPLEEMPRPPPKTKSGGGNKGGGIGGGAAGRKKGLGWSATGAELGRWMGMAGDDSDSDHPARTPRKGYLSGAGAGGIAPLGGAGMLPTADLAGGTPSNFGRVGEAALADADPLGVNTNVTFDEVGGLDEHIHSLKEMTLLPLLYPEVFQRFNVTPPRGVLFHGPPGTGKTLLARALAASCRSGGRQISFFMRKGADCLSKWVGEAERQLRLLFEEARNSQPSIIFFDEIDGLAPVRSSKQDQIHASIVSTLLALMDGMDGRGQVVVIGATNRPDAIDPALRRPGRFDREFYFGLPALDARERILGIMTRKWEGWGDDAGEDGKEKVKGLARLTKGYGGADLRALCTEAALNAIQRRYPQIYKSTDRLLLKPETIGIQLRDFMISIKKLVPSSARSSSSAATPLPTQFVPVLGDVLDKVKSVIERVMPMEKKLSALEEAEFEDEGEEGALERELFMQSIQTMRVYRPRVILHGHVGMGQGYVGAAALHHLEGYHVQSLELGTLLSDSTRTVEAAIVQLFVEAKRHQPSVIYIPSLVGWCAAVSETSRSTVRAMLDTLAPTDPILLLAIVDGSFSELPKDVKAWFGPSRENRIQISAPSSDQRQAFFESLLKDVKRPPNEFADGVKRRKRILEELPIAPPLEPRKPTAAELAVQEENDQKIITLLKYRLGPILTELKRKFKRFTKRAPEEYQFDPTETYRAAVETIVDVVEVQQANGVIETEDPQITEQPAVNGHVDAVFAEQMQAQTQQQQLPPLFDMDLEKMHTELYRGRYLTPRDFLDDVGKMVHNAEVRSYEDQDRFHKAQAMYTAAQVSIQEFDAQLRLECERMAVRERQRREARKKARDEKEKTSQPHDAQNGTRRSARNIGQEPELTITDPVKLERRLKRQRSDEASTESHPNSEGEEGSQRGAKRSKMLVDEDHDHDPLDLLSGTTPPVHTKPPDVHVHFAQEPIEPMRPLTDDIPEPVNGERVVVEDQMAVDENTAPAPPVNDGPGSIGSLLNPMTTPPPAVSPKLNGAIPGPAAEPPTPTIDPENPFLVTPAEDTVMSVEPAKEAEPAADVIPVNENDKPVETEKQPTPIPMIVVERSPSPPLPDFHIDESLVEELQRNLRDSTGNLTIEQLEQLRATCLGNVWRHRKEWDRDELVRELLDVVKEFVEEVAEVSDWNSL